MYRIKIVLKNLFISFLFFFVCFLKQKISLFSRYERVTDRRTFKDRRDLWAAPKEKKDFVPERPKAKIKQVTEQPKTDFKRKPRKQADENNEEQTEEKHEEEHHEEAPAEEEQQEEANEE